MPPALPHTRAFRVYLFLCAFGFPAIGWFRTQRFPDHPEILPLRFVIGGLMLTVAIASYREPSVRARLHELVTLFAGLLIAYLLVQATIAGFPADLVLGVLLTQSMALAVTERPRYIWLLASGSIVAGTAGLSIAASTSIPAPLLWTALVVNGVSLAIAATQRARAAEHLARVQDHLEQQVEERTRDLARQVEERKRAESRAQAANDAKTAFLAQMSHDLRTPLTTVLGYAELLEGPLQPDENALGDLRVLRGAATQLTELIDDLIDISRIEEGRLELTPQTFDPLGLVEDVVEDARLRADAKRLAVFADVMPGHQVRADRRRLRQILSELLVFAVDTTETGGIHVQVVSRGPVLAIHVQDTGTGWTPAEQAALFDRTGQVPQRRALALPIARELARAMDGDLTLASTPDRGSTFTLTLPSHGRRTTPRRRVSVH
jgi:signal transduction histidine kinase